jgi:multicomponent Na+:H+ antiporter subunit G
MIELVRMTLCWFLLLSGATFCVIGGVGLLRMPDFYARTHAGSVADTLGAGLILLGLAIYAGPTLVTVKLFFILAFLWITGPIATHALVKAAYARGLSVSDHEGNLTGHERHHHVD